MRIEVWEKDGLRRVVTVKRGVRYIYAESRKITYSALRADGWRRIWNEDSQPDTPLQCGLCRRYMDGNWCPTCD